MSRPLFVVVLRVDRLGANEVIDEFPSCDEVEVYGPFTSRDDAYAFLSHAEDQHTILTEYQNAKEVYGRMSFHVREIRWDVSNRHAFDEVEYNAILTTRNWLHMKEDDD